METRQEKIREDLTGQGVNTKAGLFSEIMITHSFFKVIPLQCHLGLLFTLHLHTLASLYIAMAT